MAIATVTRVPASEDIPNADTLAAITEAREGKTSPVDMSSFDTFMKSILK